MTDGYSGNDLKILCVAAAQYPIREVMEKERKEKSLAREKGGPEPPPCGSKDVSPLAMADLKLAHGQVGASSSPDSTNMNELVKWNNQYGEGRLRRKETLTYFM
uniref:AAA ATPase AAA+ lid domain-containing protein n=1 Tax=Arundo donax TaxID=35708 RepID=A0A0A9EN35_ARUDO